MKLNPLSKDKQNWLREFDHWVTPFLEEIRDSEIFKKTIHNIKNAIELLGKENENFAIPNSSSSGFIAKAALRGIDSKESDEQFTIVYSFCDMLFLLTGKTDNNFKCQFPVYLNEVLRWKDYPRMKGKKLSKVSVPRVITADAISSLIVKMQSAKEALKKGNLAGLKDHNDLNNYQYHLLNSYFEYILNQDDYSMTLNTVGSAYFSLKKENKELALLAPMIVSYVRGSASASGGHKPEAILRSHMNGWGLTPNEDYNTTDVIPFPVSVTKSDKTRAYDFVLPYKVKDWDSIIYIQSQFYAGDSGSVSHKNVDQTSNSRKLVKQHSSKPLFVEYVDGAGYYGSLNGDLKKLINMSDTENFIQVRTFPIKLRQLFQHIGFLTPLEMVHALVMNSLDINRAKKHLINESYDADEIDRVEEKSIDTGIIIPDASSGNYQIEEQFYKLSRKYYLLDAIALAGIELKETDKNYFIVPGYSEYFGQKISAVLAKIDAASGSYYLDWSNPQTLAADIEFLTEKKWVINKE